MAKKKRKMPGLNTSSTADISFMLLIFFLVTTSMDTDQGLGRTLPKPPDNEEELNEVKVKERNIFYVRISKDNDIMIGNDYVPGTRQQVLDEVKERAKEFIQNKDNRPDMPEVAEVNVNLIGRHRVTVNHVVSVQTDRTTSYDIYFGVQDALVQAYNELRDDLSMQEFHVPFKMCTKEQQDAVREVYPMKISEAEPKKFGEQQQ